MSSKSIVTIAVGQLFAALPDSVPAPEPAQISISQPVS